MAELGAKPGSTSSSSEQAAMPEHGAGAAASEPGPSANSLQLQAKKNSSATASSATSGSTTGNIKVFLRIRPTTRAFLGFTVKGDEDEIVDIDLGGAGSGAGQGGGHLLAGDAGADQQAQIANNSKHHHRFKFDRIFNMDATQEEVFKEVAVPVITDALNGVNGTIFAYGQTGSGKTFTITGGSEKYVDRGLIPRTISEIFERIRKDGSSQHQVFVSYLEIYNNSGYDLLSRDEQATKLEALPKVTLREDEEGNTHLRSLSVNVAATEEDALNLLFLGDTNRVVAETPMNDASTRSHCIFILWIQSSEHGSDLVRRSKIHLVDLAGSERVSKTGVEGKLLSEAKFINVSLHFLEQVIVALQERANSTGRGQSANNHIPYRNSMMTQVLRDSLGGNCKTVMVGTVAVEASNIHESLSTCRFAQRVACVKNAAVVNEDLDPSLMIKRLKRQVAELKDELKQYQDDGEDPDEPLSVEQVQKCRKNVQDFVEDVHVLNFIVGGGRKILQESFRQFRELVNSGGGGRESKNGKEQPGGVGGGGGSNVKALQSQVKQLELEVAQRDQEIGILVSIVNRNGEQPNKPNNHPAALSASMQSTATATTHDVSLLSSSSSAATTATPAATAAATPATSSASTTSSRTVPVPHGREAAELLLDRAKAFEVFRKSVRRNESFEENKELLRKFYTEAKSLGEEANSARQRAAGTKTLIQQHRVAKANVVGSEEGEEEKHGESLGRGACAEQHDSPDDEEQALLAKLERDKKIYADATGRLRHVKHDIERIQQVLEQNKKRLQKDFESWFVSLRKEATESLKVLNNVEEVEEVERGTEKKNNKLIDPTTGEAVKLTGNKEVDNDVEAFYRALGR